MKKPFKKIYVEITNRCNLSCAFCPPTKRPGGHMTQKQFTHVLKSIRPWTDYIYLHVKGEPLIHPQLSELLTLGDALGFYINITTNGTLLAKSNEKIPAPADILLSHPVRQINISLHSFESNTHLPGAMSFEDYIMSTLDFATKFSPAHGITVFRLWNLAPAAAAPSPAFASRELSRKNLWILDTLAREFQLPKPLDPGLYQTKNARLGEKIYLSFDHEFDWPDLKAPDYGERGSCQGGRTHLAILCDGTVVPCCLDGEGLIALGNIFDTPFETIIKSPRYEHIIEGFRNHKIIEPLCRRCGYRRRF